MSITFHYFWPFILLISLLFVQYIPCSHLKSWYHGFAENCWIYHLSSVWTHVPLTQIYPWIKQQGSILLLACYRTEQTINSQRDSHGCGSYTAQFLSFKMPIENYVMAWKNSVVSLQVVSQGWFCSFMPSSKILLIDALTTLHLWLQIASFIIYACYDLTFFFASNKQNTDIIYTITYHYISYFVLIIFEYLLLRWQNANGELSSGIIDLLGWSLHK